MTYPSFNVYTVDPDQPVTCPKCGARTDFAELQDGTQLHTCLNAPCGYTFITEFDEEQDS